MDPQAETPVLAVVGVAKSFGPVQVLHQIGLRLEAGQVHAIIGENGAGKSTLMKILSGYHHPTEGQVMLDGQPITLSGGPDGEARGIVLIHQEFNLAEHLTVEENIFLGRELTRGPFLDKARMRRMTREWLDALECRVPATARVADLSVSDKQMVEIAKATSRRLRVLIMDEPTAVLTPTEAAALFRLIDRLKAQGVAIAYISHKLDELKAVADRVTVLRDGRLVASRAAAELSQDDMAHLMVGRELADLYPAKAPPSAEAEVVLEVAGLGVPGLVEGVSFALRRGEILGFAGLIGAGRTELVEGLVGLRPKTGRVRRRGREVALRDARDAVAERIVYLTEDRKGKGLLLDMQMAPNVTLLALDRLCPGPFLDARAETKALDRAVATFDVRAGRRDLAVRALSGGNQQKLMLAKVMEIDPEIVIFDEPTRGIDIGTKQQIYHFIAEAAAQGRACIVISSELPEVIGLCHRVAVMRAGRLAGILEGGDVNEGEIVRYATGLKTSEMKGAA